MKTSRKGKSPVLDSPEVELTDCSLKSVALDKSEQITSGSPKIELSQDPSVDEPLAACCSLVSAGFGKRKPLAWGL